MSDQYWLNPVDQPLDWKDINFYDNAFSDDVGNILFGQMPQDDTLNLVSPCNTSRRLAEKEMENIERSASSDKGWQWNGSAGAVQ